MIKWGMFKRKNSGRRRYAGTSSMKLLSNEGKTEQKRLKFVDHGRVGKVAPDREPTKETEYV